MKLKGSEEVENIRAELAALRAQYPEITHAAISEGAETLKRKTSCLLDSLQATRDVVYQDYCERAGRAGLEMLIDYLSHEWSIESEAIEDLRKEVHLLKAVAENVLSDS